MFSFAFAPHNWATCDGQLLAISQNSALFALLGTTYGGNGTSDFALPDLRSRTPIHTGQGPGLTDRPQGERGGEENHTLTTLEMPKHGHSLQAAEISATNKSPAGAALAQNASKLYRSGTPDTPLAASTIANAGGDQPHPNRQPYATVNFSICVAGIFPSRD